MVDPEAPNPLTTPGEARNRLIFRLLGPVEARRGDVPIELGGPLQRALLGCLLLRVGEVVSRERLIDDLWDAAPPSGAGRALETKVSRLRAALGSGADRRARAATSSRSRPRASTPSSSPA
jgi:DNA-binding SARP family transcriptional activator